MHVYNGNPTCFSCGKPRAEVEATEDVGNHFICNTVGCEQHGIQLMVVEPAEVEEPDDEEAPPAEEPADEEPAAPVEEEHTA